MVILKQIIIVVISMLFLSSCITEKKCWQRYPPKIVVKDSIVFKEKVITIRDTIVISGDTVISTDTVYVDKLTGLMNSNKVWSETDYSKAYAQVINSKLFLELIQKDTAIERLLRENIQIKEVYKTEIVETKVWEVHWYDKVARFVAGIFILAIFVVLAMKIIKSYIKPF